MTIALTGATGELGQLVVKELQEKLPNETLVAVVRDEEKAKERFNETLEIRFGDYLLLDSLEEAFEGIDKLLFISSPNTDDSMRVIEHANVVKAARDNRVKQIYYTSIAHADRSNLTLAKLHRATEAIIKVSAIPYTFIRNPLYTEVFVNDSLKQSIKSGQLLSNTGNGKLNTVPRKDLAKAIAEIVSQEGFKDESVELASSTTWTFDELARLLSELSGEAVTHESVSYGKAVSYFVSAGLPEAVAHFSASMYQSIAEGETEQTDTQLKQLIGNETDFSQLVKEAILD